MLSSGIEDLSDDDDGGLENWQLGDPQFDTEANVSKRMELRHHPIVVAALRCWWSTAQFSVELEARLTSGTPLLAEDQRDKMSREQYMKMSRKIYKAMIERWDENDAAAAALADWNNDRHGGEMIDSVLFMDGIFELADLWTPEISPELYGSFLQSLFGQITEGVPPITAFWRADEAIAYGGYKESDIVEKPSLPLREMRDAERRQEAAGTAAAEAEAEAARLAAEAEQRRIDIDIEMRREREAAEREAAAAAAAAAEEEEAAAAEARALEAARRRGRRRAAAEEEARLAALRAAQAALDRQYADEAQRRAAEEAARQAQEKYGGGRVLT